MPDPLILYSINSSLAYNIARTYYGDKHYVWCTPHFNAHTTGPGYTNPPSSSPVAIYQEYKDDIRTGDRHSAKIKANRAGIIRGATQQRKAGAIDDSTLRDINDIVRLVQLSDFEPLVYVIPYSGVSALAQPAPIIKKAHPLSVEYIIPSLPRDLFDIIVF